MVETSFSPSSDESVLPLFHTEHNEHSDAQTSQRWANTWRQSLNSVARNVLSAMRKLLEYCNNQARSERELIPPLAPHESRNEKSREDHFSSQDFTKNASAAQSDAGLPPAYDTISEPRKALRIIGHCRACPYIATGRGGCAAGCKFIGTTSLLRPWQLKMQNPGRSSTYVQLLLEDQPPAYGDQAVESRQALRMVEHVRGCAYIKKCLVVGDDGCVEGCQDVGTALFCRPWQLKMQDTDGKMTYVQLLLAHNE